MYYIVWAYSYETLGFETCDLNVLHVQERQFNIVVSLALWIIDSPVNVRKS